MDIPALYDKAQSQFGFVDKAPIPYVVRTGSFLLDRMLGCGGYPAGRIIEIYGAEGTGKTTFGLHAMANAQGMLEGGIALIDMERALDEKYAAAIGLKGERNKTWLHFTPETGEQCIDLIIMLLNSGVQLIVVDSVAAMIPKAELEGDTGEAFMGLQARMMGQGLRKITGQVSNKEAIVIFINQVRSKIGVFFGPNEVTTGGRALAFFSSIRLEMRPGDKAEDQASRIIKVKTIKNKVGMPFKVAEIPIVFGRGIDKAGELFQVLQLEGIITKRSSFFYYDNKKIGAGAEDAKRTIRSDLPMWMKIFTDATKPKKEVKK